MCKISMLLLGFIIIENGFLSPVNAEGGLHFKRSSAKNPRILELRPNNKKVLFYFQEIVGLLKLLNKSLGKDGYPKANNQTGHLNASIEEKRYVFEELSKFSKMLREYQTQNNLQLTSYYLGTLPLELKDVHKKVLPLIKKNPEFYPYLAESGGINLIRDAGYEKKSSGKWVLVPRPFLGKFDKALPSVQEDITGEKGEGKEDVLALFNAISEAYENLGMLGGDVLDPQRELSLMRTYYSRSPTPKMTAYHLSYLPGLLSEVKEKFRDFNNKKI